MPRADDARNRMKLEEEALKRLLLPYVLSRLGRTRAGMTFTGPAPRDRALGQAFNEAERKRVMMEWRLLAGRLGLQTALFERSGRVNRWLDPSLDRVRAWFRSSKSLRHARIRTEVLSGVVGTRFQSTLNALIAHAQGVSWTQTLDTASWRAFVYADEREVAYWFQQLKSTTAATHLDEAIVSLGATNLRKVPASLQTPAVLRACLASARSSVSLDFGDEDQHTIIERLLTELAKLHPPILDTPETRVHLVTIVSSLTRAERFLVEELRWDFLQSEHVGIVDLLRMVAVEEAGLDPVDSAA